MPVQQENVYPGWASNTPKTKYFSTCYRIWQIASRRKGGKEHKRQPSAKKMVCICASKLQIFDRTINPEYKVEIATAFRVAVNAGLFWQFYIHQKLHPFHRT